MSGDLRDLYCHQPYHVDNHNTITTSDYYGHMGSSIMADSSRILEVDVNVGDEDSNMSIKEDKQVKETQEKEDESPKKENKSKKKGEKKERQSRFAFMTKSKVDHLDDGYRWRKYGQKAVKNSPYPRSYYRCTYQKCSVKKRVERSLQDPSVVITTYEGSHNHHLPTSLRGNINLDAAGIMFHPASMLAPPSPPLALAAGSSLIPPEFLVQMMQSTHETSSMYQQTLITPFQHMVQFPDHDYGLLQDILPNSMLLKQNPN